jgi:hypothetical protein
MTLKAYPQETYRAAARGVQCTIFLTPPQKQRVIHGTVIGRSYAPQSGHTRFEFALADDALSDLRGAHEL